MYRRCAYESVYECVYESVYEHYECVYECMYFRMQVGMQACMKDTNAGKFCVYTWGSGRAGRYLWLGSCETKREGPIVQLNKVRLGFKCCEM